MQLVLNTFGASLFRKGELFKIHVGEKKVEVAAKKIQSILLTTGVTFSSDCIKLAIENNIDIVLLDKYGDPYGRFFSGKMGSTATIRKAQLKYSNSLEGLEIVKSWANTKLENQKLFLKELLKRRPGKESIFEPKINHISKVQQTVKNTVGTPAEKSKNIMGLEGTAAAAYWSVIGNLPPNEFKFAKRSQYPAKDPVNAMINYAYGVLYSKVERACIIAGLDPYIGIMHCDSYNRKSLVFDLIEPFRIFADRVVIKLFTGKRCHTEMFRKDSSEAIVLKKEAKELLINNLNEHLNEKVRYRIKSCSKCKKRQIKRLDTIQAEAHSLANKMLGKNIDDIPNIVQVENLFNEKEQ